MLTVTTLARRFGLARSTVLYYERIRLLPPPRRSASRYRQYGEPEIERLRQICAYRSAGLTLSDVRALLERRSTEAADVLKRRLLALDQEIETKRRHQQTILRLLQGNSQPGRMKNMTKDKWVSIMRATGFSEEDMRRWHAEFEASAPEDHQEFLEFLHIEGSEIARIRAWSRKGGSR